MKTTFLIKTKSQVESLWRKNIAILWQVKILQKFQRLGAGCVWHFVAASDTEPNSSFSTQLRSCQRDTTLCMVFFSLPTDINYCHVLGLATGDSKEPFTEDCKILNKSRLASPQCVLLVSVASQCEGMRKISVAYDRIFVLELHVIALAKAWQ